MSSRIGWFVVGGTTVAAAGAILLYTHWTPDFVSVYDNTPGPYAAPVATFQSPDVTLPTPIVTAMGRLCRDASLLKSWTPIEDTDASCEVVSPPNGAALPATKWTSCGTDTGMPSGCQRLDNTDWVEVTDVVAGLDQEGNAELAYRATCTDPDRDIVIHANADGAALGAVAVRKAARNVASCDVYPESVGNGAMFVSAIGSTDTTTSMPMSAERSLLRVNGADTPTLVDRTARGTAHSSSAASPLRFASWDGHDLMTQGKTAAPTKLYSGPGEVRGLVVAGDFVAYTVDDANGQPAKVFASTAGAPPSVLATLPKDMRAYALGTDGHGVVFYECDDAREHTQCNLIVGQVSNGGGFTGSRLAEKFPLPADHDAPWVVGPEIAAHQVSESAIDFVTLKDGAHGTLRAPAAANGGGFEEVVLVSKKDVFVHTKDGLLRFPATALPAPLVAEGPGTPVGVRLAAEDEDSYWEGGPPWYVDDDGATASSANTDEDE